MRNVGVILSLTGTLLFAVFFLHPSALPASAEGYHCAQDWRGPALITQGGILPLPNGYALVDRSVSPHWFNNYSAAMGGANLGVITAGRVQDFLESQVLDQVSVEESSWRMATRQIITEPQTALSKDQYVFPDDFVLSFSGAALPYAKAVAGCYADLISGSDGAA